MKDRKEDRKEEKKRKRKKRYGFMTLSMDEYGN